MNEILLRIHVRLEPNYETNISQLHCTSPFVKRLQSIVYHFSTYYSCDGQLFMVLVEIFNQQIIELAKGLLLYIRQTHSPFSEKKI